jgi:4-hydroxy-3-methylbut-2-enyl diphosphate reductase IspH
LVSNKEDVDNLAQEYSFFSDIQGKEIGKVAVLTQTTLSVVDTKKLIDYIK